MSVEDVSAATAASKPVQSLGHFELKHAVCKTEAMAVWHAWDTRAQSDVALYLPRKSPSRAAVFEHWSQDLTKASRLNHPRLAQVLAGGQLQGQPFVSYALEGGQSLAERISRGAAHPTIIEVVTWAVDVLDALAYAHESGLTHRDLSLASVLIDTAGRAKLMGVSASFDDSASGEILSGAALQKHRSDSELDVLMVGLWIYRLLVGSPALDETDLRKAALRVGQEIVRLPWTTPQPVEETLRAIVNRATDRQQRQRYLNARTLLSALEGWLKVNGKGGVDPLALFLDRIQSVGHLPSRDKAEGAYLKMFAEGLRVDDVVDMLVTDPAKCWELLRVVNTARHQAAGHDDGVTSLSRAIVLVGQQGLRQVCSGLRPWPGVLSAAKSLHGGPLGGKAEDRLGHELKQAYLVALIARWLRPFNIGDDEAMMAAMSQRLGWLLILYHYPEESAQIENLMAEAPNADPDGKPSPGMSREAATGAVLGINPDDLTAAVMKYWGYPDALIQAARPLGVSASPRRPESPSEWLVTIASLANELGALVHMPADLKQRVLSQILSRYARATLTTQAEMLQAVYRGLRKADPQKCRELFPRGVENNTPVAPKVST